jgi:hypothetical protein
VFREDKNENLVSFSSQSFLRRSEARPDCLNQRCQFVLKPGWFLWHGVSIPIWYRWVANTSTLHHPFFPLFAVVLWIRIRIVSGFNGVLDPDPGGQKWPTNIEKS